MLALPPDTIAAFLAAAPERFAEGTALLDAGHSSGAVYLFGYVGELVIKAVAFRHYGYAPPDEIAKPDREAIASLMKTRALAPQGPHDILKWARWVVSMKERLTGMAYPVQLATAFEYHAAVIDAQWAPGMRYHALSHSFADALSVQQSARWFLTEQPGL